MAELDNNAAAAGGGTAIGTEGSEEHVHGEDIFEKMLNPGSAKADGQGGDNSDGNAAPKPDGSGEDKRYAFWQSKADEERVARIKLEQRLEALAPIINALESDEDLQNIVTSRIDGKRTDPADAPPKEPERPANYSDQDAFTNPQSESAKYRVAYDRYLRDMVGFANRRAEKVEQTVREQSERQKQAAQRAQELEEVGTSLQREYQFTPAESQEFVRLMTDPRTMAVPNLVRYYRFLKAEAIRGGAAKSGSTTGPTPIRGSAASDRTPAEKSYENFLLEGKRKA